MEGGGKVIDKVARQISKFITRFAAARYFFPSLADSKPV